MISPLISMNFFKSLSVRLKLLTLLWLVIAVASISYTLLISWRLEGSAAAPSTTSAACA